MTALKTTVRTDFSRAPQFRAIVERGLRLGVSQAAVVLAAQMIKIMQTSSGARGKPSAPGTPPMVQRGGLWQSITSGSSVGQGISAWAGAQVPYAAKLERGGIVRAKGDGYLTVPLNPAAARLRQVTIGSLKNSPTKMRVVKTKNGKLFLVASDKNQKRGTSKIHKNDWLFVLKRSIDIKARPWAKPSLTLAGPKMLREFSRVAGSEIRGQTLSALRREVSGGGNK
jgi:hypothetical protein